MVDKRLLVLHFGNTRNLINLRGKKPYVKLIKSDGEEIVITIKDDGKGAPKVLGASEVFSYRGF